MSHNEGVESQQAREDFAAWLIRTRRARGKRPIDLVEAAAARGAKLSTGQITNWEKRRNPPSPESARLMAELLNEDPVEALRAAGHDDWVEFVESQRIGVPRTPQDSDLEFLAKLRSSSDPEMHKLADRFEEDLERIRRVNRIEFEELQRRRQAQSDEVTNVNTSVNKSA